MYDLRIYNVRFIGAFFAMYDLDSIKICIYPLKTADKGSRVPLQWAPLIAVNNR